MTGGSAGRGANTGEVALPGIETCGENEWHEFRLAGLQMRVSGRDAWN